MAIWTEEIEGREAYKQDRPEHLCPYKKDTKSGARSRKNWMRGYAEAVMDDPTVWEDEDAEDKMDE